MKEIEEKVMRHARKKLSEKRLGHVERVVAVLDEIAQARSLPLQDCRIAGWLHDAAKEEGREVFLDLVRTGRVQVDEETLGTPSLWHGFHASYWGEQEFGIDSNDILDAVRFHPTGAPGLAEIGLALFVADYTEPGREIRGTGEIREQAKSDLPGAALRVVREKIAYISNKKGKAPHSRSLAFRDWLLSSNAARA